MVNKEVEQISSRSIERSDMENANGQELTVMKKMSQQRRRQRGLEMTGVANEKVNEGWSRALLLHLSSNHYYC